MAKADEAKTAHSARRALIPPPRNDWLIRTGGGHPAPRVFDTTCDLRVSNTTCDLRVPHDEARDA